MQWNHLTPCDCELNNSAHKRSCCGNGWWFWRRDHIIFLFSPVQYVHVGVWLEAFWDYLCCEGSLICCLSFYSIYIYFSSIQLYAIWLQWFVIYLFRTLTSLILGWHDNSRSFLFLLKFGQPKNPNIYSILCLESKLPGTGRGTVRIRLQMEIIIPFDESFNNILQSWGEEGLLVWLCVTASRFQCESKWNSTVSIDLGFALGVSLHEKLVSYVSQ